EHAVAARSERDVGADLDALVLVDARVEDEDLVVHDQIAERPVAREGRRAALRRAGRAAAVRRAGVGTRVARGVHGDGRVGRRGAAPAHAGEVAAFVVARALEHAGEARRIAVLPFAAVGVLDALDAARRRAAPRAGEAVGVALAGRRAEAALAAQHALAVGGVFADVDLRELTGGGAPLGGEADRAPRAVAGGQALHAASPVAAGQRLLALAVECAGRAEIQLGLAPEQAEREGGHHQRKRARSAGGSRTPTVPSRSHRGDASRFGSPREASDRDGACPSGTVGYRLPMTSAADPRI